MADFNAEELPTVDVTEGEADAIPAEQIAVPSVMVARTGPVSLGQPGVEVV